MNPHPRQLPIPSDAASDDSAIELARIWAAGGKQHVALATGLWKDPAAWGMMLVDLAHHVARAYEQTAGITQEAALTRIREGFDAEWSAPTDTPSGKLIE